MSALKGFTAALAFGLELCLLSALVWWAFHLPLAAPLPALLGVTAPLAVVVVWGMWLAPRASRRIRWPIRGVAEATLFVLGVAALWAVEAASAALALLVAVVVRFVLGALTGLDGAGL